MSPGLLALSLVGCAAHRPQDSVARVEFAFAEGERGLARIGRPSPRALRNAMALRSGGVVGGGYDVVFRRPLRRLDPSGGRGGLGGPSRR